MSICLFFIAHRRLKKKQPSYISNIKCLKPDDLCLKYNSVRNTGMSLHVHLLPVCHFTYTLSVCHFTCIYFWCATSRVHTISMHLHVYILLVCHFMCTYRYVTPHAHIIGMSLNMHILLVCHFTCTYYCCHFTCAYFRYFTSCAYCRYVSSRAYTVGVSLHVHIPSVYHFMCTYYRYVTSFEHTMNVVFKLCPHSSTDVVLYCPFSCLKGTCTLERNVNSYKCMPSTCLVGHCLSRKVIRSLSASGCVGMSRAAGCRR